MHQALLEPLMTTFSWGKHCSLASPKLEKESWLSSVLNFYKSLLAGKILPTTGTEVRQVGFSIMWDTWYLQNLHLHFKDGKSLQGVQSEKTAVSPHYQTSVCSGITCKQALRVNAYDQQLLATELGCKASWLLANVPCFSILLYNGKRKHSRTIHSERKKHCGSASQGSSYHPDSLLSKNQAKDARDCNVWLGPEARAAMWSGLD